MKTTTPARLEAIPFRRDQGSGKRAKDGRNMPVSYPCGALALSSLALVSAVHDFSDYVEALRLGTWLCSSGC